ncbi:acyltransferase [Flavobacterium sp. ANB]|uniref:acyltransferase family protein n=1 Tax=unclassified Flavobacterium TaxID=196869 RepID=UPI0012B7936B|nr:MULTISPECIES: acyltransferase [unclassified Flavobacterium]MBF4517577.1 acyltransferase [Flavobacterium sp. ANB]MTD70304.1 acyltransferase family protein [Flavobacterium sp. LC2016-13]
MSSDLELKKTDKRISVLDGFRAIAIISVLLYHYFYRWNDVEYPYFGGDYFHYGFKGVSFFFIISGFVICYSLESTQSFFAFWKKRFIRLFPSMFIASILTFTFLFFFDFDKTFGDSNHFRNVLISFTFLPPNLFDWLFRIKNHFSYLNYSYWSLWPEIQFYFLASAIYFTDKFNFKRNFLIVCFTIVLLYHGLLFLNFNENVYFEKLTNLFNLVQFLALFLCGALFYMLYKNKINIVYAVLLLPVFLILNFSHTRIDLIVTTITFLLFYGFIYNPEKLRFLENRFIVKIGVSSYFLYLIHEYIGVVWIRNIVGNFYPNSFIAPVLILIFMIVFSILYTQKIEFKIGKYLNNLLLKRKNE